MADDYDGKRCQWNLTELLFLNLVCTQKNKKVSVKHYGSQNGQQWRQVKLLQPKNIQTKYCTLYSWYVTDKIILQQMYWKRGRETDQKHHASDHLN